MTPVIQDIIEYIEKHLFESISIANLASKFSYSESEFRVLFKSNFNITVNDYIRKRRLTQIAFKIKRENIKAFDCSELLFYENVESFLKAFKRFHGVTPRQVFEGAKFRCFNRINVNILIDGGDFMDCTVKRLDKLLLTGFKTRMQGDIFNHFEQEMDFFENTRDLQEQLESISKSFPDKKVIYSVINKQDENGFDYYIAYDCGGQCPDGFELITIPEGEYWCFETERCKRPTQKLKSVRETIKNELKDINLPVIDIYHWYLPDSKHRHERYIEVLRKKDNR